MKALLVISHGSRRSASNTEVFELTAQLREQSKETLSLTACAFLEIAAPQVQATIDKLVTDGATEILIFPHFLAAGIHVSRDIPTEVKNAQARHPNITFEQLPHLGALPGIPALILNSLSAS